MNDRPIRGHRIVAAMAHRSCNILKNEMKEKGMTMCNAIKGWPAGLLVTGLALFVAGCSTVPSNVGPVVGDKMISI